jgi:DNA-binding transcriptional regulator YhcF (GntR family)
VTVSKPHIVLISSAPVPVDPVWSRAHVYLCKAGSYTLDETIMVVLSVDGLFDAAIRIQLQEQSVSVTFTREAITIKFPTTRRLAEFLQVPHYYILPYFAMMEQEELVTRAERVGILTTAGGSRKMIALMEEKYPREIEEIIGQTIFSEMVKRSR